MLNMSRLRQSLGVATAVDYVTSHAIWVGWTTCFASKYSCGSTVFCHAQTVDYVASPQAVHEGPDAFTGD